VDCLILRVGLSGFSPLDHYRPGQCIAQAVDTLDRRAVFIASGDLSHKLKDNGPYGYAPEGPVFDHRVTQAMSEGDFLQFLTMDPALCERAAECGLRSFQIMSGALDGLAVEAKLLSYEGVIGVGYGVATFAVTGSDENRRFGAQVEEMERARLAEKKVSEDPWVKLARLSLETFVKTGKRLERLPDGLPAEMTGQAAGAFVSLHAHGQLRGCIGTTGPTTESVAWEIVQKGGLHLYNELLISYEYIQDCAALVHERGMTNVLVTNGTIEEVPWRTLLPLIDAADLDLKGFSPEWYQRLEVNLEVVRRSVLLAAEQRHLVPDENDSVEEIRALAQWLASVNPEIPLHLSRFFPRYRMSDWPPTPVDRVYRLVDEAKTYRSFVYAGNY